MEGLTGYLRANFVHGNAPGKMSNNCALNKLLNKYRALNFLLSMRNNLNVSSVKKIESLTNLAALEITKSPAMAGLFRND